MKNQRNIGRKTSSGEEPTKKKSKNNSFMLSQGQIQNINHTPALTGKVRKLDEYAEPGTKRSKTISAGPNHFQTHLNTPATTQLNSSGQFSPALTGKVRELDKYGDDKGPDTKRSKKNAPVQPTQAPLTLRKEIQSNFNQVKLGPRAGLKNDQVEELYGMFGRARLIDKKGKGAKRKEVDGSLKRFSQYPKETSDYVEFANTGKRLLTDTERKVEERSSVSAQRNHIIASGVGQNAMNHMALQFKKGKATVGTSMEQLKAEGPNDTQKKDIRLGIAEQAAAVGRMMMFGRGIVSEDKRLDHGDTSTKQKESKADERYEENIYKPNELKSNKRKELMHELMVAFDSGTGSDEQMRKMRGHAYQNFLKNSFDSHPNMRLGRQRENAQVSTGFDPTLIENNSGHLDMTDRSKNLLAVQRSAILPHHPGYDDGQVFSVTGSKILSSSVIRSDDNPRVGTNAQPDRKTKKSKITPSK